MIDSQRICVLLRCLAAMPFMDRRELARVAGLPARSVYDAMAALEKDGCVESVRHGTALMAPTRRFCLNIKGLELLAQTETAPVEQLVRSYPVSAQWQRVLLRRLDGVAAIYQVAATAAESAGLGWFRWYRAHPLDAAAVLPGRRVVGLVRQGRSSDRTAFSKRVWRLLNAPHPPLLLVLMPDQVRLSYARQLFSRSAGLVFLALEEEAALAGVTDPVWFLPSVNTPVDLQTALSHARTTETMPEETQRRRVSTPVPLLEPDPLQPVPGHLLPVVLKPSEKHTLDLLSDWPWISATDLGKLLGVSGARVSQLVSRLEELALVEVFGGDRGRDLALSRRGLGYIAMRDRTSVSLARRRWSVSRARGGLPQDWRGVPGSRSRQLRRNMDHTRAVHRFIAGVARQAGKQGYRLDQLDPPWRAARYFRLGNRHHSVLPDAFFLLRKGERAWSCFLEWERRAVRPVTMAARLLPYLRYFASRRVSQDQGGTPMVLIVFEDELVAGNFLGVARREMARARVEVPLWVSHLDKLEEEGVLGAAWRGADAGIPQRVFLEKGRS